METIETAPKDGTRVLVWSNGGWWIAHWREDAQHGQFKEAPGWQIFDCDEDQYYSFCADNPTNWMPLPAAPVT